MGATRRGVARAFTVGELLCLIFVVVLFVGLLMPALSKVRKSSTRTVCTSYLRQYAVGAQMFLSDHNDLFPEGPEEWLYSGASVTQDHPLGCRWHDRDLAPGGQTPSRRCESPTHRRDIDVVPQFNYSINGYLGTRRAGGVLTLAEVRSPARVFLFGEENSWTIESTDAGGRGGSGALSTTALDDTVLLITPSPQAMDCFATYHDHPVGRPNEGSGNVVFVDGHVDSILAEEQMRGNMHGVRGTNRLGPAGNLAWAWASQAPPPGGWDGQ